MIRSKPSVDLWRGGSGGQGVLFSWPSEPAPPGLRRRGGVAALGFRGVVFERSERDDGARGVWSRGRGRI